MSRSTYDLLECIGDIGGVAEFIYYTGYILLLPFTKYILNSTLLWSVFDERENKKSDESTTLKDSIEAEFNSFKA